jgi:hypothetical protein
MSAASQKEMEEWVKCIQQRVEYLSKGTPPPQPPPVQTPPPQPQNSK